MRRELDRDRCSRRERKFLFEFGEMTMFWNAVRPDAFVALGEEVLRFHFPSSASHAAERIGNNAVRANQVGPKERENGQQDTGGIATGTRDEIGLRDFFAINFGQAINRFLEQFRGGML